jgi:hypothetical protein
MLKVTGLDTTLKKLQNAAKAYEISVTEAKKNFVWTVFRDIVVHTPQWSGNLAANWHVEVGGSSLGTSTYTQKDKHPPHKGSDFVPFRAGSDPAVSMALSRGYKVVNSMDTITYGFGAFTKQVPHVKWNSLIRIVNTTPYAEEVEIGEGPQGEDGALAIRDVNKFHGPNVPAHGIAMVEYALMKYGKYHYLRPAMGGIFNNNAKSGAK